ncbi:MAG: acyl--CoA ligase [Prevotella sp.]|nr:acyl--CoA ligase [Prevotella sp.]
MKTIENYIEHWAAKTPAKVAVATPRHQVTYGELWMLIGQHARDFRSAGIGKGSIVALRTSQGVSFLADYFALHKVGAVPMPLERDMPEAKFQEVSRHYEEMTAPEGAADLLFTTGTTGKSKGVLISHEAIMANAENLIEAHGYGSHLTFIITGPLNHLGSLSKVWPVFVKGATLYILEDMKNLSVFFQAMDYSNDNVATFMVPSSIRMLLQLGGQRLRDYALKIEFIETGAAPIAQSDMELLCNLLPRTRLFNTYASTESGIVCTYNFNGEGSCMPRCLGRPMRNSDVMITPKGSVACKGSTLMMGYFGDEERTAEVLRDGVLYTADNGAIDADGNLHLLGRTDDVINVGGYKVQPEEVEQAAMTFEAVKDCVCIGVPSLLTGSALKLLVCLKEGYTLDKRLLARHIAQYVENYKVPMLYEQVDTVGRNVNGKLDRKSYYSPKYM